MSSTSLYHRRTIIYHGFSHACAVTDWQCRGRYSSELQSTCKCNIYIAEISTTSAAELPPITAIGNSTSMLLYQGSRTLRSLCMFAVVEHRADYRSFHTYKLLNVCEVLWWVRLCVCLPVCLSAEAHSRSLSIFVHVAYGRGSVLLRQSDKISWERGSFGGFLPHWQ